MMSFLLDSHVDESFLRSIILTGQKGVGWTFCATFQASPLSGNLVDTENLVLPSPENEKIDPKGAMVTPRA
jgi:hypothetical protein